MITVRMDAAHVAGAARNLQRALSDRGMWVSGEDALDLVARTLGYRDRTALVEALAVSDDMDDEVRQASPVLRPDA
jgi:hypothetical protein